MFRMKMGFLFLILFPLFLAAQQDVVIAGPMKGQADLEKAIYWVMLEDKSRGERIFPDELESYFSNEKARLGFQRQSVIEEESVKFGNEYTLKIKLDQPTNATAQVRGFEGKDIHFLIGSCHFPHRGKMAERRNVIFKEMQKKNAEFMIWLGDNTYYLNSEWNHGQAMFDKWRYSRTQQYTAEFIKSIQHYAIWDDHDYGPNNSSGEFEGKDSTLFMFKAMWPSTTFGNRSTKEIFHKFSKGDIDFFMLDGRYHAKEGVQMFGPEQMLWLKEELQKSTANFKFIMTGNQMISPNRLGEEWMDFPEERNDFLAFVEQEEISGIVLFSGDRHYTELHKMEREKSYPLYEFTCSPLTSISNPFGKWNRKGRQKKTYVGDQNFGELTISGEEDLRRCTINTFNRKGDLLWTKVILLKDLQVKSREE